MAELWGLEGSVSFFMRRTVKRICNPFWQIIKQQKLHGKILPIFILFPWLNVESRPVPFIPRDGTGRDGIGTGSGRDFQDGTGL